MPEINEKSPPLTIGRDAIPVIEPTQKDRDEAVKRKATYKKQRTDPIAKYNANTDWKTLIEPSAFEYMVAYGNIDQAVLISIAVSLKNISYYTQFPAKPTLLMPEPLPTDAAVDPAVPDAEQDVRYSDGGGVDKNGKPIEYKWTEHQRPMAGISAYPTGQGPNRKGSIKDQPF